MKRTDADLHTQSLPRIRLCTYGVPATADVIPLPIDREILFIRQTARIVERRQGERAERFWKTECNRLYARLQVQGLADAEIRVEINRFAVAVSDEMRRPRRQMMLAEPTLGAAQSFGGQVTDALIR
ncbi:DUF6074 family protein [Mesorhizobium salmacidum]|uniref:DUF6074 family protein n=1 Tax=Mesorhizobium salmacidum TaxID=3015171 RepID=A0ABU8L0D7_9HYPH